MIKFIKRHFSNREVLNPGAYSKEQMVLAFDQSNRYLCLVPRRESNKDIEVDYPEGYEN